MNLSRLRATFDRRLTSVLRGPMGSSVTLVWDEAPAPGNVQVQGAYAARGLRTESVRALVHFVTVTSVARQGLNFQSGDAIVSFHPRTVLAGRRNLYFVLGSRRLVHGCAVTNGSKTVTCADTTGLPVGSWITGLHVPATTVASVTDATHFELAEAATGTVTGQRFGSELRKDYVQATTGRGVEEFWDANIGGERATVTLLLRLRGDSSATAFLPPPVAASEVRVIDSAGTAVAYRYEAGRFLPTPEASRALLTPTADGILFTVGGTVAARFTGMRGLEAASFTDLPLTAVPRIEFWTGGVLAGALSQTGVFQVTGTAQDTAEPAEGMAFRDALGRWLFTIDETALTAPFFTEV